MGGRVLELFGLDQVEQPEGVLTIFRVEDLDQIEAFVVGIEVVLIFLGEGVAGEFGDNCEEGKHLLIERLEHGEEGTFIVEDIEQIVKLHSDLGNESGLLKILFVIQSEGKVVEILQGHPQVRGYVDHFEMAEITQSLVELVVHRQQNSNLQGCIRTQNRIARLLHSLEQFQGRFQTV